MSNVMKLGFLLGTMILLLGCIGQEVPSKEIPPSPPSGTLTIVSGTGNYAVYLNGQFAGTDEGDAIITFERLPGDYNVVLQKEGCVPAVSKATVESNKNTTLSIYLDCRMLTPPPTVQPPTIPPTPIQTVPPAIMSAPQTINPPMITLQYIYSVGSRAYDEKIAITVNAIRFVESIENFWTPHPNYKYLIINLTVENLTGNETIYVSDIFQMNVQDLDGYVYSEDIATASLPQAFQGGDLPSRMIMRGELAFEIPVNATGLKFIFKFSTSDKIAIFKLTPPWP
jgi:hypothetical protein